MKPTSRHFLINVAIVGVLAMSGLTTLAVAQEANFDKLGNQIFAAGYPTAEAKQRLSDEFLFQSAVQTYLWALPALNMYGMKEGSERIFGKGYNVLPVWKQRLKAKTLITTPNSDVIYAMG